MKQIHPWIITLCVFALLSACTPTATESDAISVDQVKAEKILEALELYRQAQGEFPQRLETLLPGYLSEIERTSTGAVFTYRRDRHQQFYLCFDVPQKKNFLCCYNRRLEIWDCSFGD